MQKTVFHKDEQLLKGDEYANISTGETIMDEVEGDTVKRVKRPSRFHIDSDNYIVFDSNATQYLCRELSGPDIARVMEISNMVYGDCSVVIKQSDGRTAHSSETLAEALGMNLNKFYIMVRKLVKKNILSYCVCAPSGYVQKIYMLNPYIARKTKVFNVALHAFFRDVTNDKPDC